MSVFDVFINGTVTIIDCNATQDAEGGPVANYFNDDGTVNDGNVDEADIPAQVEYHRDKLFGNYAVIHGQPMQRGQRDIWITGVFDYLGQTGNGRAAKFASTTAGSGFGKITAVERDPALGGLPTSTMLVVEVLES